MLSNAVQKGKVKNRPLPFEMRLSWNCDFCKKPELVVSQAGIIYCNLCRKTYGKSLFDYPKIVTNSDLIGLVGEKQ